jgi:small subunit ribosomal protein S18
MSKTTKRPPRAKDSSKRVRKKASILTQEKVEYVDYKDVNLLSRFLSDRSKIRSRRVNGNDVQQQNEIARAVKNAREMALLPYTKRVSSQRAPRPDREARDGREERGDRDERDRDTAVDQLESQIDGVVAEADEEEGDE